MECFIYSRRGTYFRAQRLQLLGPSPPMPPKDDFEHLPKREGLGTRWRKYGGWCDEPWLESHGKRGRKPRRFKRGEKRIVGD